jgi:Domain of unknown function (DUF397)
MGEPDLACAQWSKSSYSSANGACVDVAKNLPGIVAIRDSKDPGGPKLLISSADWRTFVSDIKDGDFSL